VHLCCAACRDNRLRLLPASGCLHSINRDPPSTPTPQEADVSRDAAALMCVGHPLFTALGAKVYREISPFLDEEAPGGVTESSPVSEMKGLLKVSGASDELCVCMHVECSALPPCDTLPPCGAMQTAPCVVTMAHRSTPCMHTMRTARLAGAGPACGRQEG